MHWPRILERAYSHEIYPLLYRNLLGLGFPNVPEAVQSELKGLYLANALRNQLLAEELARLLGLLEAAGIGVIPLKGVALAQLLFGDPAARVCSDIDILVPAEEVVRARRIILANGYSSRFSEDFFARHQLHTMAECALVAEKKPLTYLVELHWTLMQDSAKDSAAVAELWSQARPRISSGSALCSLLRSGSFSTCRFTPPITNGTRSNGWLTFTNFASRSR